MLKPNLVGTCMQNKSIIEDGMAWLSVKTRSLYEMVGSCLSE